jgi:hypothetical protein
MSLLSAAVELLRDAANRYGASIDADTVRHELGGVDFSRAELVEYLKSANVHKLLKVTCSAHVEMVWAVQEAPTPWQVRLLSTQGRSDPAEVVRLGALAERRVHVIPSANLSDASEQRGPHSPGPSSTRLRRQSR